MNCAEFQEGLQGHLDGVPVAETELQLHLAECPSCREVYAAAERLQQGLRLLPVPAGPPGLAERIVAGCVREQRLRRLRRQLAGVAALAAAVLLVLLSWPYWRPAEISDQPRPRELPLAVQPAPAAPAPPINASVAEAGSAVVSLARRTTNETILPTPVLWPEPIPMPRLPAADSLPPPPQGLRDVEQGMYSGLEPVAKSARRAVGLFLRDLPPMTN